MRCMTTRRFHLASRKVVGCSVKRCRAAGAVRWVVRAGGWRGRQAV